MARLGLLPAGSLLVLATAAPAAADPGVAAGARFPAAQALLRAEPEDAVQELLQEKLLVLDRPGDVVHAYVVFDRPMDRVYQLLSATSRQDEYRSELEGLETVERVADGHVDEHRIRILFMELRYRVRYRLDPGQRRIAWELAPGFETAMSHVEGSWELYAMTPTRTLGSLASRVDVGDAVPAFVEQAVTRGTLPRTLERCRRWVNADGGAP